MARPVNSHGPVGSPAGGGSRSTAPTTLPAGSRNIPNVTMPEIKRRCDHCADRLVDSGTGTQTAGALPSYRIRRPSPVSRLCSGRRNRTGPPAATASFSISGISAGLV